MVFELFLVLDMQLKSFFFSIFGCVQKASTFVPYDEKLYKKCLSIFEKMGVTE